MKHMKFLTFFFCIAFAVFACSSNNETDPNAGGLPDKEEPLVTAPLLKVPTSVG